MNLIEFYTLLLIKQYWENPNAKGEITFKAENVQQLYDFFEEVKQSFDLDLAVDDRLDKIGKLVGINRVVPFSKAKELFGFSNNPNSKGFASKFDDTRIGAPFASKFTPSYTDSQLNNYDYRTLIKAKIAGNVCHAVLSSDGNFISIQDVIGTIFDGNAYVSDRKDMTMALNIPLGFDIDRLRLIVNAGLLPSPQGVEYKIFAQSDINDTFGFSNNPNSKGFASKFDSSREGGKFARKVIL